MKDKLTTGERLKDLRTSKKLTCKQVSKIVDISASSLSDYENNLKNMSASKLSALAKFYDVSTDYLLGIDDDPETDINIKKIHKTTGLSSVSIKELMYRKRMASNDYLGLEFINFLLGEKNEIFETGVINHITDCVENFVNMAELEKQLPLTEITLKVHPDNPIYEIHKKWVENSEKSDMNFFRATRAFEKLLKEFVNKSKGAVENGKKN